MSAFDAIVVLGCRVYPGRGLSPAADRRVERAREMFLKGAAPIIVCSGGRRWGSATEAGAFADRLRASGVQPSAVFGEYASLNTVENAVYSSALVGRLVGRAPRLAIVTCDWHIDRAERAFRALGVECSLVPVAPPPPTWAERARRRAHEAVSSILDQRALGRRGERSHSYRPLSVETTPSGHPR